MYGIRATMPVDVVQVTVVGETLTDFFELRNTPILLCVPTPIGLLEDDHETYLTSSVCDFALPCC